MAHLARVEQHLILFGIATQHGHLCHTACREQARADGPVGQRTQVEHGGGVGRKAHDEQFAQDRGLWSQSGPSYTSGKLFIYGGQFLADNLSGQVDIGVPVKFHPHD